MNRPSLHELDLEAKSKIQLIYQRFERRPFPPYLDTRVKAVKVSEANRLDPRSKQLIEEIKTRFPERPLPQFDVGDQEIEYASFRDLVQGVPWTRIDGLRLVRNSDWLGLLEIEPDHFLYFLPAYMTTYLSYWPRVLTLFQHEPEYPLKINLDRFLKIIDITEYPGEKLLASLRANQKYCVVDFLHFFFSYSTLIYGESDGTSELGALSSLWEDPSNWERLNGDGIDEHHHG